MPGLRETDRGLCSVIAQAGSPLQDKGPGWPPALVAAADLMAKRHL